MFQTPDEESRRLELSLEIASDAQRASIAFWKTWLWYSRETAGYPTKTFCVQIAERFDVTPDDVYRRWLEWYQVLTSWDLAAAMLGRDIRATAVAYGSSHRRA